MVDNPVQSLKNMSHDSLYLMLSMSASFADLSPINFYLSYAIKTALQLCLVVRFCIIEGLRVTPRARMQIVTQVRRKGYSPTTSNFLSSVLVPEFQEFSGGIFRRMGEMLDPLFWFCMQLW